MSTECCAWIRSLFFYSPIIPERDRLLSPSVNDASRWLRLSVRKKKKKMANRPRLPEFSEIQKDQLRTSWTVIKHEIEHSGTVTILNLLEHRMDFKMAFAKFRDMPVESLRTSPIVKMHTMSVLHIVEQLISRLDDEALWCNIVNTVAHRHIGFGAQPSLAPVCDLS
jgi:hypothetical protein